MSDELADGQLPLGAWVKTLPKKVGAITLVRNVVADSIRTIFECELVLIFPITLIIDLRYREFYQGSIVPEHRDAFEPIYGCSVNLLLRKAQAGGEFKCEKTFLNASRLCIFNGTRYWHSVSRIEKGARKSLIGCLHFAPWPAPMARR
jgi:hypothetical protein